MVPPRLFISRYTVQIHVKTCFPQARHLVPGGPGKRGHPPSRTPTRQVTAAAPTGTAAFTHGGCDLPGGETRGAAGGVRILCGVPEAALVGEPSPVLTDPVLAGLRGGAPCVAATAALHRAS